VLLLANIVPTCDNMAGATVSNIKGKKATVRRSKRRTTEPASSVSLPPRIPGDSGDVVAPLDIPTDASVVPLVGSKPKKPFWDVGKGSSQYEQCQKVLALKAVGMDAAHIAESLGIAKQSVHNLTYLAGKNGWMTEFANAREQIEYRIMPKALRVIEEGLDDDTRHTTSGQKVSQQIALEVAGGTVFKSFEQTGSQAPTTNVIGIKIQMIPGTATEMRDGSGGGVPAYCEGDTIDGLLGSDE
jgi:hypothetical protein